MLISHLFSSRGTARNYITIRPKKFVKLFITRVGGVHLRRAVARTRQVLRVIRVVHRRLRAHYDIKRSDMPPPSVAYPSVSDIVLQFAHGIIPRRLPCKIARYVAPDITITLRAIALGRRKFHRKLFIAYFLFCASQARVIYSLDFDAYIYAHIFARCLKLIH